MVEIKSNHENMSAEDRILQNFNNKHAKIKSFNSRIYYACFILLNIFMLILSMVYINGKDKIENVSIVWQNVTIQAVLLLVGIFLIIMLLKTLPNFLKLYSRTKKRKFGLVYRSLVVSEYYSIMTMYSSGEQAMQAKYLSDNGISDNHSINMAYSKKIFARIGNLIYSAVILVLGLIFWLKSDLNIWLCIIAFIPIIINGTIVITILCFNKNKKSTINFIAGFCKFLYVRKIIKDYESFYTKIIDNLLIYNKVFKQNKSIIFLEIASNILINFLKAVMLYYSLIALNISGVQILGSIIFRYTILDSIINLWPLQKGCLIFEFLFITLFSRFFFAGYVFWGMLILRIFEYLIYIFQYVLVVLYDLLKLKLRKRSEK